MKCIFPNVHIIELGKTEKQRYESQCLVREKLKEDNSIVIVAMDGKYGRALYGGNPDPSPLTVTGDGGFGPVRYYSCVTCVDVGRLRKARGTVDSKARGMTGRAMRRIGRYEQFMEATDPAILAALPMGYWRLSGCTATVARQSAVVLVTPFRRNIFRRAAWGTLPCRAIGRESGQDRKNHLVPRKGQQGDRVAFARISRQEAPLYGKIYM